MGRWISLNESQQRVWGKVKWWECEGPYGKKVEVRQHHPSGPVDFPIWLDDGGSLYLGGWEDDAWHAYGVCCRSDGRLIVGHRDQGVLSGPIKRTWLSASPAWVDNRDPHSPITGKGHRDEQDPIGLPYIYIGGFDELGKSDRRATVILKCGTTRIGPWKENVPVGCWWEDHEEDPTSHEVLEALLDAGNTQVERRSVEQSDSNSISFAHRQLQAARRYCHDTKEAPIGEINVLPSEVGDILEDLQTAVQGVNSLLSDLESIGSPSLGIRSITQQRKTKYDSGLSKYSAMRSKTSGNHADGIPKILSLTSDITPPQEESVSEMESSTGSGLSKFAQKRRNQQISDLATWLAQEVIRYDADKSEMELYAEKLRDYGFNTVKMVQDLCTESHVEDFDWMSKMHKHLFVLRGIKNTNKGWEDPGAPNENMTPRMAPAKHLAPVVLSANPMFQNHMGYFSPHMKTTKKKKWPRMFGANR